MLQFETLENAARAVGTNASSLKVRFWHAQKLGIALPERKRIGKRYIYHVQELQNWLIAHNDDLRRTYGQPLNK
jgi:hypothetical protein